VNDNIRKVTCPFSGEELHAVPALTPDVAIVHAQRADEQGNTQVWGLMGVQKEVSFAAKSVIVVVEEVVSEETIRSDPNRTLIPGLIVSAVVHEPWGAHPSYAQGYYDRDNRFYVDWDTVAREQESMEHYLDEWVYGVSGRAAYMEKLGEERKKKLCPEPLHSPPVNYGLYR
jgi:glutaconate CoA-transferase subunit A